LDQKLERNSIEGKEKERLLRENLRDHGFERNSVLKFGFSVLVHLEHKNGKNPGFFNLYQVL
jgi:hypothetical protein